VSGELETARLWLRRFTADDEDALVELDGDPEVMRYLNSGLPTPPELIRDEILPRFVRYHDEHPGWGYWAAIEKASGEFIGWFGLHWRTEGSPGDVELGYRLRRAAWGQGYATEGARALVRRAFQELGVQRVLATTYQDNLASRRVMEKLGLRLIRRFRPTAAELAAAGDTHLSTSEIWDGDEVEYALTRAEWEAMETGQNEGQ
jgi:RimJ/RimL family protein N-acetyltransferase